MSTPEHPDERGETLIELLLAIVLMSIIVIGVLGGLATGILMSEVHRKQAAIGVHVRGYASAIDKIVAKSTSDYKECAAQTESVYLNAYSIPGGEPYVRELVGVAYWDPVTKTFYTDTTLCTSKAVNTGGKDSGIQRVTVRVRSNDNRAQESLAVIIRRPCREGDSPECIRYEP